MCGLNYTSFVKFKKNNNFFLSFRKSYRNYKKNDKSKYVK